MARASGRELRSFDAVRTPIEAVDINTDTGDIVNGTKVGKATAWQDVPMPAMWVRFCAASRAARSLRPIEGGGECQPRRL